MRIEYKKLTLALIASIAFTGSANAAETGKNSAIMKTHSVGSFQFPQTNNTQLKNIYRNASETASHYYRVGVRSFEKGNFQKAQEAFEAVLRADGLDKEAHHYLAVIKKSQGEMRSAKTHVLKYHAL